MRKKLDKITHTNGGNNWWKPRLFELRTKNILPKELEILENPPEYENNHNCFIYALGLANDKGFIKECNGFLYDTFFQKLIDEKKLTYTDNPQKGDYVLYRDLEKAPDPKMINHVGIVEDENTIISKWSWGPLVRHKIFDVPESYGSDISYIKSISRDEAKELYEKYKKFNVLHK